MHRLTNGRFMLGLGRGIKPMFDAFGIPQITTAQLEDFALLMRRLWKGEVVIGHDGPVGTIPRSCISTRRSTRTSRSAITAFGPQTLDARRSRLRRRRAAHVLHRRDAAALREDGEGRRRAGRPRPADVTVWSCFATVGDHLPEDLRLKKTVGRMATYLQGYGDLMVETNRWDPAPLARFRADEVVTSIRGAIDQVATTEQLEHIATLIPDEWLAPAATGSPEQCARAVRGQFDLGADAVILHGASPAELAPVVEAYRAG